MSERIWIACRVCERLYESGHPWIIVEKFGVRPDRWEFCCIECLGSYFEVPTVDQLKALPRWDT
jgi:hypothetical protein